jgi:hypothetical protein
MGELRELGDPLVDVLLDLAVKAADVPLFLVQPQQLKHFPVRILYLLSFGINEQDPIRNEAKSAVKRLLDLLSILSVLIKAYLGGLVLDLGDVCVHYV